jgi:hypothetical protein
MLVHQPRTVTMFVNGMGSCHSQRTDRNRPCHEEEAFMHHDSQADAQTNPKRDARWINLPTGFLESFHNQLPSR